MKHTLDSLMALARKFARHDMEPNYSKSEAVLKDALSEVIIERDEFESECLEQARLLGISGSKEAALLAKCDQQAREIAVLKYAIRAHLDSSNNDDSAGDTWLQLQTVLVHGAGLANAGYTDIVSNGGMDPRNRFDDPYTELKSQHAATVIHGAKE